MGIQVVSRFKRYLGAFCMVTSVTTPSAPKFTRAALKISVFLVRLHSMISPLAVINLSPSTKLDMQPMFLPVPWVAVPSAPANDCSSISGIFNNACPTDAKGSPISPRRVPAKIVAWFFSSSWPTKPLNFDRDTIVSFVGTSGVKLCPDPTGRI